MDDYDEEDILSLSALKFAPVEPRIARSTRSASDDRHLRSDLLPLQERLLLDDLSRQAKALQDTLYQAVLAHETALYTDTGLQDTRDALAETMLSLKDALAEQASINQFHVTRLLGAREDARQTQDRLSYLSEGDDAQQAMEEAHAEDVAAIKKLDAAADELQRQLKALAQQRTEIKKRMRDRQQERRRRNKAHEEERQTLQSELTVEQTEQLISESRHKVAQHEKEAQALEEGLLLFEKLVMFLRQVEVNVANALPADPLEAEHVMTGALEQLQIWLDEVTAKQWNLMNAIIGNELDAMTSAKALLLESQQAQQIDTGVEADHQGAPN